MPIFAVAEPDDSHFSPPLLIKNAEANTLASAFLIEENEIKVPQ